MTRQRYTVQEAAEVLGISVDAVRQRVRRGYLPSEKVDNRVYVFMDVDQSERIVESFEVVEVLRDEVAHLRDQLDQERRARTEERRRHDTLMQQLLQRVPELPHGAGEHDEGSDSTTSRGASEEFTSQPSEARPWWRRWFGRS